MAELTDTAIIQGFLKIVSDKPFDKITANDVVKESGVSRRTFYYHFHDVFSVADKVFENQYNEVTALMNNGALFEECINATVGFLADNQDAVYNIYRSSAEDLLEDYLNKASKCFIDRFVDLSANGMGYKDKQLLSDYNRHAFVGMVFDWLSGSIGNTNVVPIKQIGKMLSVTINHSIKKAQTSFDE